MNAKKNLRSLNLTKKFKTNNAKLLSVEEQASLPQMKIETPKCVQNELLTPLSTRPAEKILSAELWSHVFDKLALNDRTRFRTTCHLFYRLSYLSIDQLVVSIYCSAAAVKSSYNALINKIKTSDNEDQNNWGHSNNYKHTDTISKCDVKHLFTILSSLCPQFMSTL